MCGRGDVSKRGRLFLPCLTAILILRVCAVCSVPNIEPGGLVVWRHGESAISDQEALREAFRDYLGRDPEEEAATSARIASLEEISRILGPGVASPENLGQAVLKLRSLAAGPLGRKSGCPELLAAVTQVVMALEKRASLPAREEDLKRQKERLSWNVSVDQHRLADNREPPQKWSQHSVAPQGGLSGDALKLKQVTAEIDRMESQAVQGEIQSRRKLQELCVKLIQWGDYREAILATRFYRALFRETFVSLGVSGELATLLMPEGMAPSLQDVDRIARHSIDFVDQTLSDTTLLLEGNAVAAASAKMSGMYPMGERMPEVLSFPKESREKMLRFLELRRDLDQHLAEADLNRASKDLDLLEPAARDFDCATPRSRIEAARSDSALHLGAARKARENGDIDAMLREMELCATSWPGNPDLRAFASEISSDASVRQRKIAEFDALFAAGNGKELLARKDFFKEALHGFPDRLDILNQTVAIESEIRDRIEHAGQLMDFGSVIAAWEDADGLASKYPDRAEISAFLASLDQSAEASSFKQQLAKARALEPEKPVVALTIYLDLRRRYPESRLAGEGIGRMSRRLLGLPESN